MNHFWGHAMTHNNVFNFYKLTKITQIYVFAFTIYCSFYLTLYKITINAVEYSDFQNNGEIKRRLLGQKKFFLTI